MTRPPSIDAVQRAVAAEFKVPLRIMASRALERASSVPRQVAMALAYELTGHSSPAVARRFGDRDPTTVLHARDRIEERRALDRDLDATIRRLKATLLGERPAVAPEQVQLAFLHGPLFDLAGAAAHA